MTTLETLKAARAKIAKRGHWIKGDFARNRSGLRVRPDSISACRWCAIGAIRAVSTSLTMRLDIEDLMMEFIEDADSVANFNDTHTHPEILSVFDQTIAKVEAA